MGFFRNIFSNFGRAGIHAGPPALRERFLRHHELHRDLGVRSPYRHIPFRGTSAAGQPPGPVPYGMHWVPYVNQYTAHGWQPCSVSADKNPCVQAPHGEVGFGKGGHRHHRHHHRPQPQDDDADTGFGGHGGGYRGHGGFRHDGGYYMDSEYDVDAGFGGTAPARPITPTLVAGGQRAFAGTPHAAPFNAGVAAFNRVSGPLADHAYAGGNPHYFPELRTERNSLRAEDRLGWDAAISMGIGDQLLPPTPMADPEVAAGYAITQGMPGNDPAANASVMSALTNASTAAHIGATAAVGDISHHHANWWHRALRFLHIEHEKQAHAASAAISGDVGFGIGTIIPSTYGQHSSHIDDGSDMSGETEDAIELAKYAARGLPGQPVRAPVLEDVGTFTLADGTVHGEKRFG